jgi:hypothetical protein
VTKDWLDQLTWEGVAWWYQDDGTLTQGKGIHISTHSFPKEEVQLLAEMLQGKGISAKVQPVKKGEKTYYIVSIGTESTRKFIEKVKRFVHPSMLYKTDIGDPVFLTCQFCQTAFLKTTQPTKLKHTCCQDEECRAELNKLMRKEYIERLGGMSQYWFLKEKPRTLADPLHKQKRKEMRLRLEQNPEYKQKWDAIRSQWKKDNIQKIYAQREERMKNPEYASKLKAQSAARQKKPENRARKLELQRIRRQKTKMN